MQRGAEANTQGNTKKRRTAVDDRTKCQDISEQNQQRNGGGGESKKNEEERREKGIDSMENQVIQTIQSIMKVSNDKKKGRDSPALEKKR